MALKRVNSAVASSMAAVSDSSSANSSFHSSLNRCSASSVIVAQELLCDLLGLRTARGIDSLCRPLIIKIMAKPKANNPLNKKDVEEFLQEQTTTILDAVDERLERSDKKVDERFDEVISHIDSVLKEIVTIRDEETIDAG